MSVHRVPMHCTPRWWLHVRPYPLICLLQGYAWAEEHGFGTINRHGHKKIITYLWRLWVLPKDLKHTDNSFSLIWHKESSIACSCPWVGGGSRVYGWYVMDTCRQCWTTLDFDGSVVITSLEMWWFLWWWQAIDKLTNYCFTPQTHAGKWDS